MLLLICRLKDRRGFTMVELIIVVAIVAALTAILVPTINYHHDKSRMAAAQSSAKTIKDTLNTFMTEASVETRGRKGSAPVAYYRISFSVTGVTISVGADFDNGYWVGMADTDELEDKLEEAFTGQIGSGSAVVAVKGNSACGAVYSEVSGVAAELEDLFAGKYYVNTNSSVSTNFVDSKTKIASLAGSMVDGQYVGIN